MLSALLRRAIDRSGEAFIVIDDHSVIQDWNRQAELLFGWPREAAIGSDLSDLIIPEDLRGAHRQAIKRRIEGGDYDSLGQSVEIRAQHRDGRMLLMELSIVHLAADSRHYFAAFLRDVTTKLELEKEIRLKAAALQATDSGVLITDRSATICWTNPAFSRMTGYAAEEVCGQTPRILKSGSQDASFYEGMWTTILSGMPWNGELTNRRRDGSLYEEEMSITPIRGESGAIEHFVAVKRDVTECKRDREALSLAKRDAEEANRAKDEFLANMSHEVRTPLNGVIGFADLLLDSELESDQRTYVESIHDSAESLLSIVNDILDISKLEADAVELEPIAFDLETLAEDVAGLFGARAAAKGIEVILHFDPTAPCRLIGDPGRIRQVLSNLVGNAIKFTSEGHVLIDIRCEALEPDRATMRLEVRDTGIGVPEEKRRALFERFSQADTSTCRLYGGTGLGLAISKHLVEMMGGTIGVEEGDQGGSSFFFIITLPIDTLARPELPSSSLDGARVLIVDDNRVNRFVLSEQVSLWGMESQVCSSAKDALVQLREANALGNPFRIAIIDHQMPGMDGEELARHVKEGCDLGDPRLVMLSSVGRRGIIARLREAGVAGYLVKPARQSDLLGVLTAVLGARSVGEDVGVITRHTIREADKTTLGRNSQLSAAGPCRVLLAEDNQINRMLAQRMLEKLGCSVEVATNGMQAVEKSASGCFDLILMDCHMPEVDGYEATQMIRKREESTGSRTAIVAITANAMEGSREKCMESGMDDYISKPMKIVDLETVLANWAPALAGPAA